jgi:hypothetical protein
MAPLPVEVSSTDEAWPARAFANLCECKSGVFAGNAKAKLIALTPPELRTLWVQCGTALETR